MIAAAVLSVPFVVLLARRPVLRRLAVRNAVRRPREALLVLLGSMLGTAIITGSFVVGDTLHASLRHTAFTRLGPADLVVQASDAALAARVLAAVRSVRDPRIDGVLPLTVVSVAVTTASGDRAEPHAQLLEVDFAEAAAFGGDAAATGIEGETPAAGAAVLGADLARTLAVGRGDAVRVHAYGREVTLRVERTLERRGVAGFGRTPGSESPNVFVAPGTIAALAPGGAAGGAPPLHLVAVSSRGGVIEGAAASAEVAALLEPALGGLPVAVERVKQDVLDRAEEVGARFTELFTSIGFFSVIAGILLLVNIFVMLAQERKPELGMLRAVGLRRAGLVGAFSLEGWMYALASAVVGAAAGIGLGRVIVVVAAAIFAQDEEGPLDLIFATSAGTVQRGFAIGFAISLATVVLTSLRVARLNVIRAIRDLPEPEGEQRRRSRVVVGAAAVALGLALTVLGIRAEAAPALLAGVPVLLAGLVPLLGRTAPGRPVVSGAAVLALAWSTNVFALFPDVFDQVEIVNFVLQGVLLTAAAVALVSSNQDAIGALLRRLGGGERNMALRLGLAYPLARRFRTGMILSMYALVVFTLTFITVFSALFQGQVEQFTRDVAGGFDLVVRSNPANPVPPGALRDRPEVRSVAALHDQPVEFSVPGITRGFERSFVSGFDAALVEQGPPALEERSGRFASDTDAYRALLSDPTAIIVSEFFLEEDGGGPPGPAPRPGDRITLRDPVSGATRELTVAAVAKSSFGGTGSYVSLPLLRELYGARVVPTRLFVGTRSGADAQSLADRFNGEFLANGADADSFRAIVSRNLAAQSSFFRLMQGYLALGLLVGIAGLGVVMVRAVRERRRQVGVLRSLGFEAAAVRRAFLVESAFVAVEGVVIGVLLALVTARQIVASDTFGEGLEFTVPWASLALLVLGTLTASLLATVAPAQQAARIRPAVALRVAD